MLYSLGTMNYLVFGGYFFLISILTLVGVSLVNPAPSLQEIENLTFSTLSAESIANNKNSYTIWDIVITIAVVALVVSIMIFFNGS